MVIDSNTAGAILSHVHDLEMHFCNAIKSGVEGDTDLSAIKQQVTYFWENHLKAHFLEEELLFKDIDDVFCTKGKNDHRSIVSEIERIVSKPDVGQHDFLHLVSVIFRHIQFEERVLFPHLKLLLTERELRHYESQPGINHLTGFNEAIQF